MSSSARGLWSLKLYPAAGEGGGSFQPLQRQGARAAGVGDPDRSRTEAARRAAGQLRRYCASNRLNRLGTLTYAQSCHAPAELRRDLARFFRALRQSLGEPLPYVWVPEWHPGGHGQHAHFAVGRYVRQPLIRELWGRGHVHIKLLGDLPVGSGSLAEARSTAGYLAKYVSKSISERRLSGSHRYGVAEGFQPAALTLLARSEGEVLSKASERMGAAPAHVWRSSEQPGWCGPPAVWCGWSD